MQFEITAPYALPLHAIQHIIWNRAKNSLPIFGLLVLLSILFIQLFFDSKTFLIWSWSSLPWLFLGAFLVSYFCSRKQYQQLLKNPVIHFTFSDDFTKIVSGMPPKERQLKWNDYNKLERLQGIWLLFINARTWFPIPTELLTIEQQTFILDKLKENQVKIR